MARSARDAFFARSRTAIACLLPFRRVENLRVVALRLQKSLHYAATISGIRRVSKGGGGTKCAIEREAVSWPTRAATGKASLVFVLVLATRLVDPLRRRKKNVSVN